MQKYDYQMLRVFGDKLTNYRLTTNQQINKSKQVNKSTNHQIIKSSNYQINENS